ncbi:MAG: hypothetical protein IV086_15665 [Hyphomonadaceae bacterium]|nr:MAG: hypothetical protein FD160_3822 [Caulobacteraceae bacterium]MBT9447139.1 hypothetical protein [Hyphomonadaceae bacterium]TPW05832.1 MAG: hypothetical protein FD124_2001 [Alphaproteobacteria bacterium]
MATLPNGGRALVEPEKLTGYILNLAHRTGRNKARVFLAALGLSTANANVLGNALSMAAQDSEAILGRTDAFGAHYAVEFVLENEGKRALVRSLWTIRTGEDFPRLVSAFVKDRSDG